jgi:hypothetical protein
MQIDEKDYEDGNCEDSEQNKNESEGYRLHNTSCLDALPSLAAHRNA